MHNLIPLHLYLKGLHNNKSSAYVIIVAIIPASACMLHCVSTIFDTTRFPTAFNVLIVFILVYKGSKNISIKILKDVGMTVPKSRETSVVYIYAAIQGMRDYIYMQQGRG